MTQEIQIQGMTCKNCVRHVTEALAAIDSVSEVEVDLASARAQITSSLAISREQLVTVLDEAGYSLA